MLGGSEPQGTNGVAVGSATRPRAAGPNPIALAIANPWLRFLVRRLVGLFVVLLALVAATMLMVRVLPGDVTVSILGENATETDRQLVRYELGIQRPVPDQFISYTTGLFRGDFGTSFITKQPVRDIIADRLPKSASLAAWSLLLVMLVSVPLGLGAGALTRDGRHRRLEVVFTAVASVLGSVPQFLTATFLAFVFAVWLRLLPVAGSDTWQVPVLSIAISPTFILARIVRVETLNVLARDYIRTAESKRLGSMLIYFRHALPNVLTAALTIGGLLFANLIGGAVLVENIFARSGLGTALVSAIITKDYPVVQSIVIVLGLTVVLINTVVDIALSALDPRTLARQG
jgi:peptide/nickel transport system permease protein